MVVQCQSWVYQYDEALSSPFERHCGTFDVPSARHWASVGHGVPRAGREHMAHIQVSEGRTVVLVGKGPVTGNDLAMVASAGAA